MRGRQWFALVVDTGVQVDDLIRDLRGGFVFRERAANTGIKASTATGEGGLPAAAHLLSTICAPVLIARARPAWWHHPFSAIRSPCLR